MADIDEVGSACGGSDPFALQVLGDSMETEFPDGCIVIIDPSGLIEHEAYVFAKYEGEYIFRQLYIEDGEYTLVALNKTYSDLPIPGLEAIYGRIVQRSGTRRSMNKHYG